MLFKVLGFIGIVIILIASSIYLHEYSHMEINYYFGCQNVVMHLGNQTTDYVAAVTADCHIPQIYDSNRMLAHSLNEVVFDSITVPLITILSFIFAYMLFKEELC
jgi:hypothetical protein